MILPALLLAAALPHVEQVTRGVWAVGFSAQHGSANGGWFTTPTETVLIDLDLHTYRVEVQRITGKPVRATIPENVPVKRIGRAIYLVSHNVLFAGPEIWNGPPARLEALHPEFVVPGFGSWGGPELISRQRRFLAELRRQVAYGITMDRPLEAIEQHDVRLPATYYTWMPYDNPRPEDIRHVYSELTVPNAPYNGRPPSPGDNPPHALVLIGDRPHEPEHLEAGLRPALESAGVVPHFAFDVRALSAENLARVRLLVILRDGMMWPAGPSKPSHMWMTPEQEKAVVDFVHGGGSFLNLHNAMGLSPKDGPYLDLIGGRYIGHGPLERFRTEVADPNHPITQGVSDYFAADEQHTPPYDEKKVHLFLRSRSDDGKTAAAGWAYEPGRGRLVHLAGGHTRDALEHPMYQRLLHNALNWCLRR